MNPKLILLRHAETDFNAEKKFSGSSEAIINTKGKLQIISAGQSLADIPFYAVFTSTKNRAKETMWGVIEQSNIRPSYIFTDEPALDERSFGLLEGMTFSEAKTKFPPKKYKKWDRDYFESPPLGESLSDVEERVVPFFKKRIIPILEMDKNVLIVSHGITLKVLLGYIYNMSEEDIFEIHIENAIPIEVNKNSIFKK